MPALSETDQIELLMRVLECCAQTEGWRHVLDFIDTAIDCKSFLAEFDEDGLPLPRLGGLTAARDLGSVLQQIETEGGRTAFQFLVSEAALFYPYCKTSLTRGGSNRNAPAGLAIDTTPDETVDPQGDAGHSTLLDTLRMSPGLVSPLCRTDGSTILFGCLFTTYTPDSIDVDVASETFRTIVKALAPGLNLYFRTREGRLENQFQRLLLSAAAGPAILINADRDILAFTPSAPEALAGTDTAGDRQDKLVVRNKQLDAALLELAVATRQQPDRPPALAEPLPRRDLCVADPEGELKRISIRTVYPEPATDGTLTPPLFVLKVSAHRDIPEGIEKCLQDHFDLSQSEAHLARQLTITGSMNATAEDLGITRNTAKTHLRRVYEKTGVNTQLQLAMLVHKLAQLF